MEEASDIVGNNLDGNISSLTIEFEDGKIFHARYGKVNLSIDSFDYNLTGSLPS